jgi:DNA-binding response OmpR family regulator
LLNQIFMKNILIVEDDGIAGSIVAEELENAGFGVQLCATMKAARELVKREHFDLAMLDLSLPDGCGFDFADELRSGKICPPIIYITSHTDIEDIRKGFENGGADYIKKPFDMEELLLRTRRVLNEFKTSSGQDRAIGEYLFNPTTQQLRHRKDRVILGRLQSVVLEELSNQIGVVIPKDELLTKYWGEANYFTSRNLDSVIVKLRFRFKNDASVRFLALKKDGYRLVILKD